MADDSSTTKATNSSKAMVLEEPTRAQELAQLSQLSAQAEQKYLLKDYSAAADLYAQATELQVKLNGEMAPQNAELLFLYGRSLYQVGVSNSEVLGGKVGGAAGSGADADENRGGAAADRSGHKQKQAMPLSAAAAAAAAAKGRANEDEATECAAPSTLFQFSGDENFDGAEDDEEGGNDGDSENDAEHEGEEADAEGGPANAGEENEDDDLGAAWVSLDLARVLFARQLEQLERSPSATTDITETTPPADAQRSDKGKGRADAADPAHAARVKARLADTHDLLAEISLEHEEFGAAADDFRAALALKRALYAPASSAVAEAHYKLSLALEFASIANRAGAADGREALRFDAAMRAEAAEQMEAAIGSARARLANEEEELLRGVQAAGSGSVTKESLQELREVIADMEQRLADLRQAPISVERATEEAALRDGSHPLAGILGSLLDSSPGERRAKLEEVMQGANDLSGLVRRNKPAPAVARSEKETGQGDLAVVSHSDATAAGKSMPEQGSSNGHVDADSRAANGAKRKAEDPEAAPSSGSTTDAAIATGHDGSDAPPSLKRTKT